jgi:DNA repair exonuclease SbcCD ATPase subunit
MSRDADVRNEMAKEIAALRQRAEAAERDLALSRAACADAADRLAEVKSDLSAERDLKRAAYAKLDDVRKVVEETIIPALESVQWVPGKQDVWPGRSCPECGGDEPKHAAACAVAAALSAARKTLED